MALSLVTPPVWPVSLADAKAHLRVETADDDALITAHIGAACEHVEHVTGRAIATQTWELVMDRFPSGSIAVPLPPLQSVNAITYIDTAGDTQVWAAANYSVDAVGGRVAPAYGASFPATRAVHNAVKVRFTAGYTALPAAIQAAVLLLVGDLYANREAQQEVPLHENRAAERLLWPYKAF